MKIFFMVSLIVLAVGSGLDLMSSRGKLERNKLFKDRSGRFSVSRYLVGTGAAIGLCVGAYFLNAGWFAGIGAVGLGAWRIYQSMLNRHIARSD